jgi:hypothetical protein
MVIMYTLFVVSTVTCDSISHTESKEPLSIKKMLQHFDVLGYE